jgi:signal transduction histidine kinase
VLGIVRDVTQEQEAHDRLEQRVAARTHEFRLLLEMSRSISLMAELDPLLEVVFDQMRRLLDYESVAIGLVDGDEYTTVAVRRDEVGWRSRNPLGARFHVDRSRFPWQELAAGRTLYTPDIYANDDFARGFRQFVGDRLQTTYAHVRSLVGAPLIAANELIGAMFISSVQENRYRPHDVDLVAAIGNQVAVAIANARWHEQARAVAALEERQRLARELHDSVSQALFGIGLGAQTARAMIERDPAKAAAPIDYVVQLAAAGMAEMRALIFELRPESLQQEGLVAALAKQAGAARTRHGIAVELMLPDEPAISFEMKEALYRIAQEAMHNTAKHARASKITLRLVQTADALAMDVVDDGAGFDAGASFPGHLGLVSMRERVTRFGGSVGIESAPGLGTRIHVTLPLREAGQHDQP